MTFSLFASLLRMRSRNACSAWLLAVSMLLSLDPPQIILFLDPEDRVNDVRDAVTREACPYLRVEEVLLPVPYEVRWFRKAGDGQRYVLDTRRRVAGLLTTCP